ncbi:hypothetical protein C7B80_26675 [Cyanosarcina cf. burmensis CCALA 770]|nr:hypothetical protein C7B80_26675 [Cyanosarcina cf. burmensis CCALA 770]
MQFCYLYPARKCYEYPGSYHALHADTNYQEVLGDIGNWLEQHLHSLCFDTTICFLGSNSVS